MDTVIANNAWELDEQKNLKEMENGNTIFSFSPIPSVYDFHTATLFRI